MSTLAHIYYALYKSNKILVTGSLACFKMMLGEKMIEKIFFLTTRIPFYVIQTRYHMQCFANHDETHTILV